MRGALARSLSAAAPSSPQQVGTALTLNSAEGSSKGVGKAGSKGVEVRDVAVEDWVEEVANQSEDEMEGVAGPDGSATPSPTPGKWGSVMPESSVGRTRPMPVPVTPTRGSKRMAMGTPGPARASRVRPMLADLAATSALEQILGAVRREDWKNGEVAAVLEQIFGAIARVESKVEEAVARLEARLVEGLAVVMVKAREREERLAVRLLADTEEREKRLVVEFLAIDAIELEQAQKAKWDLKQCEDLGVMMRARREELREVKQGVDGIAAEIAEIRALGGLPMLAAAAGGAMAPAVPANPRPTAPKVIERTALEPMEGVLTTAAAFAALPAPTSASAPLEDPIEDGCDMEGIEREGLFVSQHTSELGAPVATQMGAREARKEEKKRKDKGKEKAGRIAVPPSTALARSPRGSPHQQRRQAAIDEARAAANRGVASAPAPPQMILERPAIVAAEAAAAPVPVRPILKHP